MQGAIDATTIMRLNEQRQMRVLAELADEHESVPSHFGGGTVAFMKGTHWLCGAIGCGLDQPLTDKGVRFVCEYVAGRGGRPRIDLTDQSGKAAFQAMAAGGLVLDHAERVLSRDLAQPIDMPRVAGITLERLDPSNAGDLRRHVEHTIRGFMESGGEPTEGELEAAARSQVHPRSRGYFAFVDGKLAGTCGMEVVAIEPAPGEHPVRIASLWGAVVGHSFRRRGVQQALIAHRLRQGQQEGCTLAVIECEPGIPTERNAARLGFQLAYTRLGFKAPAGPS
ncbi:MAG: GNAT family N-acetyltransferase [Phycisphaerales bacterium JB060]